MGTNDKLLLRAFRKEPLPRAPFWFMRQAGRYLPEYRQVRQQSAGFLDMCYSPDKACEVTLQPIRRFAMDAAIIFSDILVIPDALGVPLRFEEKKGPVLEPVTTQAGLDRLQYQPRKLAPVYEALRRTRSALPAETTLIGFAGAPWTLACYTVNGRTDKDYQTVRALAMKDKAFFARLIELLTDTVIRHVRSQVDAGAEVIQLFDSWSGVLSEPEFHQWSIAPAKRIVQALKASHPHIPVIGFPRLSGEKCKAYVRHTQVDGVSIDASVSLEWAAGELQDMCVVQGNLDNVMLAEDKDAMLAQARKILSVLGAKNNSFVFNLGHGILPHTPVEHVQALCDVLKGIQ
jgi:uroporphyrinogen decarboxylase